MDFVRLEIDGAVGTLTIDRPKALNALNRQVLEELESALGEVAKAPGLRALIVTGGGEKAFVAGADIAQMQGFSIDEAREFGRLGHRVLATLEALPVATIAAVNGFALGGGCELALACDLIYASEKAWLGLPEVTLAVIPGFGGTQRLTRLVGRARAKELVFTGDRIDAAKAQAVGLVLEVLPPAELLAHCRKVAGTIATRGPLAVAEAKRAIDAGADVPLKDGCALEQEGFARLFGTADQREGMAAFLERRPASFSGR